MEETKKTATTPVVLKRSRLGPSFKASVKPRLSGTVPNGNGLNNKSDDNSDKTPEVPSDVEQEEASMSVRNKEICRLHMEETNSINNVQNSDSKSNTNEIGNATDSPKDAGDVSVKKESIPLPVDETKPVANADDSNSITDKSNHSDESDKKDIVKVEKSDVVNNSSTDELDKTGEKNDDNLPIADKNEVSNNKVVSSSESVKANGASKDSPKVDDKPAEVGSETEIGSKTEIESKTKVGSKTEVVSKAEVVSKTKVGSKTEVNSKEASKKPGTKKHQEDEALSSESEEFHGFDNEHTEKSIKAKKDFIENSEDSEVTSSAVPKTPASEDVNSKVSSANLNKRMRKNIVDLTNPMYRKPFDFGWKRELVYRTTSDSDNKRQGDIYYYTPRGKKVRSAREVQEHITDPELSVDNFTFFKEPLGINDPSKEIIRDAKIRLSKDFALLTPPPKAVSRTPKAKATVTPVTPVTSSKSTPKVVIKTPSTPSSGGLKVKFTGIKSGPASTKSSIQKSKPAKVKKRKSSSGGSSELEMGMLPPMWNSPEVKSDSLTSARSWSPPTVSESTKNVGKKRSAEKHSDDKKSPPAKKIKVENDVEQPAQSVVAGQSLVTTTTPNSVSAQQNPSHYFMMNLAAGYSTLMHIFRYLNLKELLIASRVCRLWHDVASKPHFWQTVRMKNTQVSDWNGFANALIKHDTRHLDLRKMLVGSKPEEVKNNWLEFYNVIGRVQSLKRIELCRCLSSVIENLAKHVPHLESLTATSIKNPSLNLESLGVMTNLTELRLKGMSGLELTFNHLSNFKELKLLSITGIKNLNDESSMTIGSLEKLETLEIGDCNNIFEKTVTESIPKLSNLKRLRFEKGQNSVPLIIQLLESASKLPQLEILELINFDVKPGFENALGKCTNIKSLLMIPTYITQSATTNHIVMMGVSKLKGTLKQFVWGLTLELLRVTDLFIDQCESSKNSPAQSPNSNGNNKGKGKGDSIPILKPLIDTLEEGHDIKEQIPLTSSGPSKVDILPIPKLRKVLSNVLPSTDIKILKIPFSSTWRQTLIY